MKRMNIKNEITKNFNKKEFKLLNCDVAPDGEWDGIDEYIREFIKELNNSEHILTLFSCEGHTENGFAYLFFNVDEIGWDIFWTKVLPEISYNFCFIDSNISKDVQYQLSWFISTNHSENDENISTGISIHTELKSTKHIAYTDKKERFWVTLKAIFLKYYIKNK